MRGESSLERLSTMLTLCRRGLLKPGGIPLGTQSAQPDERVSLEFAISVGLSYLIGVFFRFDSLRCPPSSRACEELRCSRHRDGCPRPSGQAWQT